MLKRIIFVNISIIIFEIVLTTIIRRIYIDYVDFTRVGVG